MKKGLYIHIPFCDSKCSYCDFYSFKADETLKKEYCSSVVSHILGADTVFDTAYIGGGTPTALSAEQLGSVARTVNAKLFEDAEFTCEANPARNLKDKMLLLKKAGVNRVSMGLQSANDNELRRLSRIHSSEDVINAVDAVKTAGIDNFSLDLMMGIPEQTLKSLDKSIDFVLKTGAKHISSYMLKIEKGTPFYKDPPILPEEDEVCEMYLHTVERLKKEGFLQYEVSNFALEGYESRHNLNYWDCGEYLGIGPAAYSFMDGKRFYYERDIKSFISSPKAIDDGEGGDFSEYALLRLRLTTGLERQECIKRFEGGEALFEACLKRAQKFKGSPLINISEHSISLTPQGFLVSNAVICQIV